MGYDFKRLEKFVQIELSKREAVAMIDTTKVVEFAESLGIESREGFLPEKLYVSIRRAHIEHTPETSGEFGNLLHALYEWEQNLLVNATVKYIYA